MYSDTKYTKLVNSLRMITRNYLQKAVSAFICEPSRNQHHRAQAAARVSCDAMCIKLRQMGEIFVAIVAEVA